MMAVTALSLPSMVMPKQGCKTQIAGFIHRHSNRWHHGCRLHFNALQAVLI